MKTKKTCKKCINRVKTQYGFVCNYAGVCFDFSKYEAVKKYKNKTVVYDGYSFDSLVECEYYKFLKMVEKSGLITNIQVHPVYEILPKFQTIDGRKIRAVHYELDFSYYHIKSDRVECVDVKGKATEAAKLKRKMFEYRYPEQGLIWVCFKNGRWIDYDELNKRKRN